MPDGSLLKPLRILRAAKPIVLTLPRGGVPVAFEVATALRAVLARKIGAPGQPELGVGAIVDGANPHLVLNDDVLRVVRRGSLPRSNAAAVSVARIVPSFGCRAQSFRCR